MSLQLSDNNTDNDLLNANFFGSRKRKSNKQSNYSLMSLKRDLKKVLKL